MAHSSAGSAHPDWQVGRVHGSNPCAPTKIKSLYDLFREGFFYKWLRKLGRIAQLVQAEAVRKSWGIFLAASFFTRRWNIPISRCRGGRRRLFPVTEWEQMGWQMPAHQAFLKNCSNNITFRKPFFFRPISNGLSFVSNTKSNCNANAT